MPPERSIEDANIGVQGGDDADTLNFSGPRFVGDAAIDQKALAELRQSSLKITKFLNVSLPSYPENLYLKSIFFVRP